MSTEPALPDGMTLQAAPGATAVTTAGATPKRPTPADVNPELPTAPCSVVWSDGHSYVREDVAGAARWAGVDDRGRARFLTDADLRRRGWSLTRA